MKRTAVAETNLDGLIQRIKKEAVEEGKAQSHVIVAEAEKRAADIIKRAEHTAATILRETDKKIEKQRAVAEITLQQAARDAVLSVQNTISGILNEIIHEECRKSLSGKSLESLLLAVVEGWQKDKDGELNLAIILNEADRKTLSSLFLDKLKEKVNGEIELRDHPSVSAGFRIQRMGEHFYYDLTDRGIAEILSQFLNKELAATLDPIRKRDNGA